MDIRTEIQINAVKRKRSIQAIVFDDFTAFTAGTRAIYVAKEECLIDITKLRRYEGYLAKDLDPKTLRDGREPAEIDKNCVIKNDVLYRKLVGERTGTEVWVKQTVLKGFEDCLFYIKGPKDAVAAVTDDGTPFGVIMPVVIKNDEFSCPASEDA